MNGLCANCEARQAAERFFLDDADPGCPSCQILAESLRHFHPPNGPRGRILLVPSRNHAASPIVRVAGGDENESPTGLIFYTKTDQDARSLAESGGDFFRNLQVGRDIDELPSTQSTLDLISKWDQTCRESHSSCHHDSPKLPSRVIDVRITDGKCKLVEPRGERDRYMTLSHCWGKLQILTTLKNNIDAHYQGIDLQRLPKTFQDAIWMTGRLGIRYLWIDSLCIVQDDADDWAKESSEMATIYSDSYLTLAASSAKDGSEGLFKARDNEVFSYTVAGPDPVTVCVRLRREHECLLNIDEESREYFEEILPLNTRAWVYQERLLSPRFLHFAPDELIWECREARACECGQVPQPRYTENRAVDTPDRLFFQGPDAEEHWYKLVKRYTQLNITKPNDRLPAFSGIARRLVDAEDYLAGLRRSHVLSDLLWLTTSVKSTRPASYQAPSWSWASVMGPIIHPGDMPLEHAADDLDIQVQVRDISVLASTADRFGRVDRGELRVSGRCFDAQVLQKDKDDMLGSTFGRHWLRIEIPELPPAFWPTELLFDTVQDARDAVGSSVVLLAIPAQGRRELEVSFLMLGLHSQNPTKLRRLGLIGTYLIKRSRSGALCVQDVLKTAKIRDLNIV